MSKKLPGLNRRAPDIEGDDASPPEPEAAKKEAEEKQAAPRRKSRARRADAGSNSPREASASEGARQIEAEVLPPETGHAAVDPRFGKAVEIVRRRAGWAMAGGLLPIPVVDVIAVVGVQLTMLAELSALYGVPFKENRAKSILIALLGGLLPYAAGTGLAVMIGKSMPILGWGIGLGTMSLLSGATTQAAGAVFIQHFESGGTFMDFDAAANRAAYRREYEKARRAHAGATA